MRKRRSLSTLCFVVTTGKTGCRRGKREAVEGRRVLVAACVSNAGLQAGAQRLNRLGSPTD